MNNIEVRKATKDDLTVIQEIARNTIDNSYRSFMGDESVDWFINSGESDKELANNLDRCDVLVRDGGIAAFTIYFEDLIHLMMVDVNLHRSGLGTKLLDHSEKQLFKDGKSTIRLETFEDNKQAINFYKKNHWCLVKEERDEEHGFVRVFFEKNA